MEYGERGAHSVNVLVYGISFHRYYVIRHNIIIILRSCMPPVNDRCRIQIHDMYVCVCMYVCMYMIRGHKQDRCIYT